MHRDSAVKAREALFTNSFGRASHNASNPKAKLSRSRQHHPQRAGRETTALVIDAADRPAITNC
ncbi:hypothetical protein MPS_2763 [Mycobacterium pseudoshottsii JCM 15466]|nr:hypothetical protein MPS_2763 [Mycobacterium pseudoshottsii JCM 15466]